MITPKMAHRSYSISTLAVLGIAACSAQLIEPAKMQRVGVVDERFQSYNVEMVEVIGGRFWKPYRDMPPSQKQPTAMTPDLFQQRPPIDLSNPRLRKLAAALGPAYVRVSGTWANSVYFHNSDQPAPKEPPKGFTGVLTRAQWKGVIDFARAVDGKLVTSFAISPGTRDDATGVWTPAQARALLEYTKSLGGNIAAAEFMNEPTFPEIGGSPKGYDAAAYARDLAVFIPFAKKFAPNMLILGPGSVGEGVSLGVTGILPYHLTSEDLLKATGPVFGIFSYHSYASVSKRCAGPASAITAEAALSDDYLTRPDKIEEFYASLRDRFEPGKPIWVTETADAACGGNPWASTFVDTLRYLDQLGRLAKRGSEVHMHNTLASSDYGLLDDDTLMPRPHYWAALLWHNFMGTTVLDAGPSKSPDLHLYAHCLRGQLGGVAILAINTDQAESHTIEAAAAGERYTLTAEKLDATTVQLNGKELTLGPGDVLPPLKGSPAPSGQITFTPASSTFLVFPNAKNPGCR